MELREAFAKRQNLLGSTNACRLCNGIADGFDGLVIDKYASHYQVQFFNKNLIEHEQEYIQILKDEFSPEFIAVKYRFIEPAGFIELAEMKSPAIKAAFGENSKTTVEENGIKFSVDLMDTLNPGLFLDMRDARLLFGEICAGKDILNLFAYTCSFSVYARMHGAAKAVSVDISKKNLSKGKENFALNNLNALPGEFFCGSAEEYVGWCVKKGKKFGAIAIDPPSFAKNGKNVFSVARDFSTLAAKALSLLEANGVLLLATNYSEWNGETLQKMATDIGCKILRSGAQGRDFPGSGETKESTMNYLIASI